MPDLQIRVNKLVMVVGIIVVATIVIAGLTDRENPVYPGVMIESKKPLWFIQGSYCSAGVPIITTDGKPGLLTASHCTDPSGYGNQVFQPWYDFWAGDKNYAGYSIDWGTDDPYNEVDKRKPDAAVWIVQNRGVSNRVPLGYCWRTGTRDPVIGIVSDDQSSIMLPNLRKLGHATGCTGTAESVRLLYDERFSGRIYAVEISKLLGKEGDSGGLVFSIMCINGACGIYAVGIVVGGFPKDSPTHMAIQSAGYALRHYGVRAYVE